MSNDNVEWSPSQLQSSISKAKGVQPTKADQPLSSPSQELEWHPGQAIQKAQTVPLSKPITPGYDIEKNDAITSPGDPGLKGVVTGLFDPGVLLDPMNLAIGAGAGAMMAGPPGAAVGAGVGALAPTVARIAKGAAKGTAQAAAGLYGPITGFAKGFVKGLRAPHEVHIPSAEEAAKAAEIKAAKSGEKEAVKAVEKPVIPKEKSSDLGLREKPLSLSSTPHTPQPTPQTNAHTLVPKPTDHIPTQPITAPVPEQTPVLGQTTRKTVLSTVKQRAKDLLDKWPVDRKLITAVPQTPVISLTERFHASITNDLNRLIESPWFKELSKMSPEQRMTQAMSMEQQAMQKYDALVTQGVPTQQAAQDAILSLPAPWNEVFQAGRSGENAARGLLGLPALKEISGPYLPRMTMDESKEMFELLGAQTSVGTGLRSTTGVFDKERTHQLMLDGLKSGVAYEDPLKAIVLREWAKSRLINTAEYIDTLMKNGVLTPFKSGVPRQSPWKFSLEGLPGAKEYSVGTREEALFLKQNLSSKGKTGAYYHILNHAFRNPNLWNPLPHIVKNMGAKYWMAGGNPTNLIRDAKEYTSAKDPLVARFKQVMPFTTHGKTEYDITGPYVHPSMWNKLLSGVGLANSISSKIIFAHADPIMRYSLWKNYVKKGFSDQAAANHVWVDLIRYSMRSELVDTWKSIPFNFFVPWRIGSTISLSKNLRTSPFRTGATMAAKPVLFAVTRPIRTALVLGIIDMAREGYYRQTGETFHVPADYVEGPLSKIIDDPKSSPYIAATWGIFGPGGESVATQLQHVLESIRGTGEGDVVKRMFWGLAQGATMAQHMADYEKDGDVGHLMKILAESTTGMYQTAGREPHHMSKYIPEELIPKDQRVRMLERYRETQHEKSQRSKERAPERKEARENALRKLAEGK